MIDNKGIGWIIAGVVLQWVCVFLLFTAFGNLTAFGLFLLVLTIGEATLCTVGVVQLNRGSEGWIIFFLVYSIIGSILAVIRGLVPVGAILLLVGAIVLKINN